MYKRGCVWSNGYLSRVHIAFIAEVPGHVNVRVRLPEFESKSTAGDLGQVT